MRRILNALAELRERPQAERVDLFNTLTRAAAENLLHDLPKDPCLAPQLLPVASVAPNDYNPNTVAFPEMDLLEQSMTADGITMPVVVAPSVSAHEVVDGFHRRTVAADRLGRKYLPCSMIDPSRGDRMASTVRHNRARGKHQVELMGELVKGMIALGWTDARIAESMGMSEEEVLRLRQLVGVAQAMAGKEYHLAWRGRDGAQNNPSE